MHRRTYARIVAELRERDAKAYDLWLTEATRFAEARGLGLVP